MNKQDKQRVLQRLYDAYGDPRPELTFGTPFELLVAVILSAQCTDKRVNIVTDEMFKTHSTPQAFAALGEAELADMIRTCGLANSKAKAIIGTSKILLEQYGGEVPQTIEQLQKLPGVGRKTANVVASVAFGVPAIAVDTHVQRVSNRIGLARSDNVVKTEEQLMRVIPKEQWSMAHHWLIYHGRRVCMARNPQCDTCFLADLCDHNKKRAKA